MGSEPTPSSIALAEISMVVMLFLSLNWKETLSNFFLLNLPTNITTIMIFLLLWFPFFGLMIFFNPFDQAIRDFIAAVFICLPFLGLPNLDRKNLQIVGFTIFIAGIFFALRELSNFGLEDLAAIGSKNYLFNDKYLLQDAIVLFAALFAVSSASKALENLSYLKFFFFAVCLVIVVLAFLSQALRLNIFLTAAYIFFVMYNINKRYIKLIYVFLLLFVIFFISQNLNYFEHFLNKIINVGSNGKLQEFISVWEYIFNNFKFITFGKGFGGEFFSPTYDTFSNYTHSFLSYLLLKSGILGFLAGLFLYSLILIVGVKSILTKNTYLQISTLSILPALLTQPTYKSFGFGIVLWLLVQAYKQSNQNEKQRKMEITA